MRTGNILFSAVHFFVVLAILALGGFFIAFAKIPHVQFLVSKAFSEKPVLLFPIGILTIVLGAVLMVGLYAMNRKRYYQVRMKFHKADVEEAVIQKYVEKYWQEIFPGKKFMTGVLLYPNRKIEVIAEIPDMPEEEQIELLEKIEIELGGIFARNLKYERDFDLTVVLK